METNMKQQNVHKYCLDDLPEEVIRIIFKYLPDSDVFTNLRLVSSTFKKIVDAYLLGNFLNQFET